MRCGSTVSAKDSEAGGQRRPTARDARRKAQRVAPPLHVCKTGFRATVLGPWNQTLTTGFSRASAEVVDALKRLSLVDGKASLRFLPLPGGVSSDIWRIEIGKRSVCAKRALPRLKVAADWRVPVERSSFEAAWMETANGIVPGCAPRMLGHDSRSGLIFMEYLDADRYRLWKEELRRSQVHGRDAREVASRLVRIHSATANRPEIAKRFSSDPIFHAIRLEPYLKTVARSHTDLSGQLEAVLKRTAATRCALVHGDVSPKNIMLGPEGPVFLDAECAWYGDPAFDLAFCLNHLLLKCLWVPDSAPSYLACFDIFSSTYLGQVDWEDSEDLERRAAPLLAGLFLARVDGKSPVEYVTKEKEKNRVRRVARGLLKRPARRLQEVRGDWAEELNL